MNRLGKDLNLGGGNSGKDSEYHDMNYEIRPGSFVEVDDDIIPELKKHRWQKFGHGYFNSDINKKPTLLHRFILKLKGFDIDGKTVDHKNCNTYDCRIENLRLTTPQNNSRNCRLSKSNRSGLKGVHYRKAQQKYVAGITFEKKFVYLGFFKTAEEAARAYDSKAIELFGEFAMTNEKLGLLP